MDNVAMGPPTRQRMRRRVQPQVTQLDQDSYNIIGEYESEEDDGSTGPVALDNPKHIFRDASWNKTHFTYDPAPLEF